MLQNALGERRDKFCGFSGRALEEIMRHTEVLIVLTRNVDTGLESFANFECEGSQALVLQAASKQV